MLKWDGRIERMRREHGKREVEVVEQIDLKGVSITLAGGDVVAQDESGKRLRTMTVHMQTICFDPGAITFEASSREGMETWQLYPHSFRWTIWPHGAETILRELWGIQVEPNA